MKNKLQQVKLGFDQYANEYQEKFMDFELYDETFNLFCDSIVKEKASLLEVGCGPGNISRYILKRRPKMKLIGVDVSENMITLAKQNNPAAQFELRDGREIINMKIKVDAILCGFCLPYLSKQEALKLIEDGAMMLNSDGILYISTMEGDYKDSRWQGPSTGEGREIFTYYHEEDYLLEQLGLYNFEIIHKQKIKYPEADICSTNDLIIIAKKRRMKQTINGLDL